MATPTHPKTRAENLTALAFVGNVGACARKTKKPLNGGETAERGRRMAEKTKIEWCDATVSFWWGCTKVSPGCDHCYAESWNAFRGNGEWGPEATAVEVYPPHAEIVDDADMYHLWVLAAPLPFSLFPRTSD